jgi:hypothetical protein
LNIFLLLFLVTNLIFVIQLDIPEAEGMYLPAFLVIAIFCGYALEWVVGRLAHKPKLAWGLILIPCILLLTNYPKVDQSQHTLHARIAEKILSTAGKEAVIIADDYEYAEYLWYYLLGEEMQQRNLFALPDYAVTPEDILGYLRGEQPLYIHQLRRTVPAGLRVFVMSTVAPGFEQGNLTFEETESKHLLQITLP